MSSVFHERRFEARFRVRTTKDCKVLFPFASQKRTCLRQGCLGSLFRELEKEAQKKIRGKLREEKTYLLPRFTTQEEEEEEEEED